MRPFPHRYSVSSTTGPGGDVILGGADLPALPTASPVQFDGPGGRWSPEDLLVAAVADCFILTFRGIAKASSLRWISLTTDVTGTLERVERVTKFTSFEIRARVEIPADVDEQRARRIAIKAEETCLVARSLTGAVHLTVDVDVVEPAAA